MVVAPGSRLGPMTDAERDQAIKGSLIYGHYEKALDRESAYEKIQAGFGKKEEEAEAKPAARGKTEEADSGGGLLDMLGGMFGGGGKRSRRSDSIIESAAKSAARSVGTQVGRAIIRGVLGSILGGKR